MEEKHCESLLEAGRGFDRAWPPRDLSTIDGVRQWVREALEAQGGGTVYPFVVVSQTDGNVIGSTRYLEAIQEHRTVEIGWTWYSPRTWGTAVNPECKLLLLRHAFEDWNAIRVQLKTDVNNLRSQRAILKLGARFEGRLRNQMVRRDGSVRDSVMYSIVQSECPDVKIGLESRLKALSKGGASEG
ncbi:MAG: GNAT family N-acetyltransferase [Nitrososphaerales archaeon]|nr:GNAT family N-acetyltransferase [Nitrososphaerales archaeon]